MGTMATMRILVVGAGSIGKRHHWNLLALGAESTLLRYSDFAEEVAGTGWSTRRLRRWDGAVVATATHIRAEVIGHFAAAGVPLYIEKPLSFRIEDLRDLAEATREIAARSMVGFMMRYHPALRYLGERDLSDAYAFAFEIGHDVRRWRPDWRFAKSYAARADGGGALLDLCHELDMAWLLFPRAKDLSVRCLGHRDYPGVDVCTDVQLSGSGAPLGRVSMDYLSPASFRRLTVRGRDATFEFDFIGESYSRDTGSGAVALPLRCERNAMFLAAMRDFLDLIAGHPVSEGRHVPRLDLAAESCTLIARAWGEREFSGMISGGLA